MKRSAFVVVALIAAVTAMIWSGVMAYRIRKSMHSGPVSQTSLAQDSISHQPGSGAGSVDDSPTAQGLEDLRGKPAPAFTLKTPDGKTVSLADYKGKAVLLNFWATWCGPCKLEMPWLIELQKKYAAQGFTVLGISEDDGPPKQVADFASKMGINYPIVMSDDKLNKSYGGVDYLPTSYYIGRDGKIAVETGGVISQSQIEQNIKRILAPAGAPDKVADASSTTGETSPADSGMPSLRGQAAPAFTLKTPEGKTVSLADYKGKAVLLNFWGTWCAPCKLELPWLIELQKKYGARGFTVLGVAENEDSPKNVADFATKMKVDYPLVMGDDNINKAYKCCDSVPTSYYIGRDGKVSAEVNGLISESDMEADIQKILATKGA